MNLEAKCRACGQCWDGDPLMNSRCPTCSSGDVAISTKTEATLARRVDQLERRLDFLEASLRRRRGLEEA